MSEANHPTPETLTLAGKSLGVWGGKKFHVVGPGPGTMSLCGRFVDGETKPAREVQPYYRCHAKGCAGNWPDYRKPGDTQILGGKHE